MSVAEIEDWMAYEMSIDPDFRKKIKETPVALPPDEEADAIRHMFAGLQPGI